MLLLLVIQRQIQTKLLNIYKKTWFEIRKIHKEEVPVSFNLVTKIQIMYNTSTCLFGVQYSNILLCTNYESTHLLPDSARASLYPLMIVSKIQQNMINHCIFHLSYSHNIWVHSGPGHTGTGTVGYRDSWVQ